MCAYPKYAMFLRYIECVLCVSVEGEGVKFGYITLDKAPMQCA